MTHEISSYTRLLEMEARLLRDPFWARIARQLDEIVAGKPTHSHEVITLLDGGKGKAFFHGSGGDRQLLDSLLPAGWEISEYNASYYWAATHPATGDSLEYIEGDVYDRTIQ